jgi:hypothetical protein
VTPFQHSADSRHNDRASDEAVFGKELLKEIVRIASLGSLLQDWSLRQHVRQALKIVREMLKLYEVESVVVEAH